MFCPYCGKEISNEAIYCPYCGRSVTNNSNGYDANYNQNYNQGYQPYSAPVPEDKVSVGFCVLSAVFPIVGIILWIVWHKETPKKARACGITALIAWGVGMIMSMVMSTLLSYIFTDMYNDVYFELADELIRIMPMLR